MHDCPNDVVLEDRPCPNGCCGMDEFVLEGVDRLHGVPGRFSVVRCMSCGLMRTNPRPTPNTIGAYYPKHYAPYLSGEGALSAANSGLKSSVRRLIGLDARQTPPVATGRLLEIGCASGGYLEQMHKSGWEVEGIEFDRDAAERVKDRGFSVQVATVETARPPHGQVDLVAAWMVLEHLHEPVESLRRIRSWIKPGGYLIASVPDANAIERRVFGDKWYALQLPTHLYHYDVKSLEAVLRSAGWRLVRVMWQKNCINLLRSLECVLALRGFKRSAGFVVWLRTSKVTNMFRVGLGWMLGVVRQSGRIEFWAQPFFEKAPLK